MAVSANIIFNALNQGKIALAVSQAGASARQPNGHTIKPRI